MSAARMCARHQMAIISKNPSVSGPQKQGGGTGGRTQRLHAGQHHRTGKAEMHEIPLRTRRASKHPRASPERDAAMYRNEVGCPLLHASCVGILTFHTYSPLLPFMVAFSHRFFVRKILDVAFLSLVARVALLRIR